MRLIADIGGTNARFALVSREGRVEGAETLQVADHATLAQALDAYRARHPAPVTEAAIAAAGPRIADAIDLTNAPWRIVGPDVSRRLDGAPVRLLNDLEAVALLLPLLMPGESELIGGGPSIGPPMPLIAINIGTGFGAALAVPLAAGGDGTLATEAGHIRLLPATPAEAEVIGPARTVEEVFSGPGLRRLRQRCATAGGRLPDAASRLLGRVIGDLILATGAWGGAYLCGGVTSDFDGLFERAAVLSEIPGPGAMARRLGAVPLHLLRRPAPVLTALARAPIAGR